MMLFCPSTFCINSILKNICVLSTTESCALNGCRSQLVYITIFLNVISLIMSSLLYVKPLVWWKIREQKTAWSYSTITV